MDEPHEQAFASKVPETIVALLALWGAMLFGAVAFSCQLVEFFSLRPSRFLGAKWITAFEAPERWRRRALKQKVTL